MMTPNDSCDCPDYTRAATSRRGLLKGLAAVAGAGVLTSVHGEVFRELSYGATPAEQVLVVLSMRGGVDGLSVVVPHGDPAYYTARPRIAVPAERLLAKDAMFGLHPAMEPLLPLWASGRMAAVQATGMATPNRSHFAAMELVEDADPGSAERRGWVNRLIGLNAEVSPVEAVNLSGTSSPTLVYGAAPHISIRRGAKVAFPSAELNARRDRALATAWGASRAPDLKAAVVGARHSVREFAPVRALQGQAPLNGAVYPSGDLGRALADTARMLRADVGVRVVTLDHGTWDHHASLGTLAWGSMLDKLTELSRALAAFFTDLGGLAAKVTVVTISEFGRRVRENANYGVDHGWGNVMLALGAGVKGGAYYGRWPGLADGSLIAGDLQVTTDYRSVLAEVLRARTGADTTKVFPGFTPTPVGLMA